MNLVDMTTDANDLRVSQMFKLTSKLRKNRKQLKYSNVPIRITAEILDETLSNLAHLKTAFAGIYKNHNETRVEVNKTQHIVDIVLYRLGISDPRYASSEQIKCDGKKVRLELRSRLGTLLAKCNITRDVRRKIVDGIITAIDGSRREDLHSLECLLIEGALHGKPWSETKPKRGRFHMASLLKMSIYTQLVGLLHPEVKMKGLGVPASFKKQRDDRVKISSEPKKDGAVALHQEADELEADRDRATAEDQFDVEEIQNRKDQAYEAIRHRSLPFTRLLTWRLGKAGLHHEQRTSIIQNVEASLTLQSWRSRSQAEETFILGLLSGHDRETMVQHYLTVKNDLELFEILDRVDLGGLKVGQDWLFHASGGLIAAESLRLDDIMDRIAAAGTDNIHQQDLTPDFPEAHSSTGTNSEATEDIFHECATTSDEIEAARQISSTSNRDEDQRDFQATLQLLATLDEAIDAELNR